MIYKELKGYSMNNSKLLTILVPCYNSAAYMRHCIESLLPGGEQMDIIIVNDGSSDQTGEIADEYAAKYPTMIRAIHQENGKLTLNKCYFNSNEASFSG